MGIYVPKFKNGCCSICGEKTERTKYCDACYLKQKKIQINSHRKPKFKTGHCIRCGNETGKYKYCARCLKISTREKNNKYSVKYAKNNKEKIAIRQKEHYEKNKHLHIDASRIRNRIYYKKNRDKILLKYNPNRLDKIKPTPTEKRQKRNKYAREYYPKYFKNNPHKKIANIFRQRLWRLLNGIPVVYKMEELIGCTEKQLKEHIENQFQPGMSWNNHTKDGWHIDHIIQCFKFDLTNPEELKKCFHFTNLRPMWAIDNHKREKK